MTNTPLNDAELADLRKLVAADPQGFIPVPSKVLLRLIRWHTRTTAWKSSPLVENVIVKAARDIDQEMRNKGFVPAGEGPLSDCYITKEEKARIDEIILLGESPEQKARIDKVIALGDAPPA